MGWHVSWRRTRALITAAGAAWAIFVCSACTGNDRSLPADRAFALSASALAGSDRYGFNGELSLFDPNGVMANKSRFSGQVTGHGNLNVQWSGGPTLRSRAAQEPPSFHPLQLLDAIEKHNAQVVYARPNDWDGNVLLRVTLAEKAARDRMAQGLRAEMSRLRTRIGNRHLGPAERRQAERILTEADRTLATRLSTLRVNTVCLWTADRRTWFPRQMTERTELAYTWKGKPYREKRVSMTNFLPAGRNGTMVKNSSSNR